MPVIEQNRNMQGVAQVIAVLMTAVLVTASASEQTWTDEQSVWRSAAFRSLESEGTSQPDPHMVRTPIAANSSFPSDQIEALLRSYDPYLCPITSNDWGTAISELAAANQKPENVAAAVSDLPFVAIGVRPQFKDYLAFSRPAFLQSRGLAILSISWSEWSGAIMVFKGQGLSWEYFGQCGEWARY